jgi:hypothetical protein
METSLLAGGTAGQLARKEDAPPDMLNVPDREEQVRMVTNGNTTLQFASPIDERTDK